MCPSFRTEVTAVQFQQIIQNVQFKSINLAPLQPTQQSGPMQGQEISGHLVPHGSSSFQVTAGLVGIKKLTKRSQVEHFMSINYHSPGCCFHSLPIPKGATAVESSPLFLCSEYLLHAAITLLLLCTEWAGACSVCQVYKCLRNLVTVTLSWWLGHLVTVTPVGSHLSALAPRWPHGCAIAPLPGSALTPGRSKMFPYKPYWQNWKFYCLTLGKQSFWTDSVCQFSSREPVGHPFN